MALPVTLAHERLPSAGDRSSTSDPWASTVG